jgi:hypothetical protein
VDSYSFISVYCPSAWFSVKFFLFFSRMLALESSKLFECLCGFYWVVQVVYHMGTYYPDLNCSALDPNSPKRNIPHPLGSFWWRRPISILFAKLLGGREGGNASPFSH